MNIFQQTIERERKLMSEGDYSERKYLLHDPFNTDIQDIKDFSDIPVIAYSGRVDPQKGLDTILKDAILMFADKNLHTPKEKLPIFIIGGKISQNETYDALAYGLKDALMKKSHEATDPVAKEGYKNIANRIILIKGFVRTDLVATASDMFLVPSKFEPCGLTQLEAMAKGSLPIATSTGGLVNTIKDGVDGFRTKVFFDMEGWKTGDKIFGVHMHYPFKTNGEAYCDAIERGLNTFFNAPEKFEEMQRTAISNDFSWDKEGGALDQYINLLKTGRPN
jgi:glycogen synthase